MKTNELRLGNWVSSKCHKGLNTEIFAIRSSKIIGIGANPLADYNLEEIEAIPLTEEWLLKFGFEKSSIDSDNAWLNLRYRYLNFASDESVKFKKVFLTVNKMDIVCKYVHELQNLYFTLTGQELEIK